MQKILIIDDEQSICWGLSQLCQQVGLESETASSVEAGLQLTEQHTFAAIIMDVCLPGMDGLSAISVFHDRIGKVPIITITAFGDLKTAITAVQNGAFEYIVKPFELAKVQQTIEQAISQHKIAMQNTLPKDSDLDANSLIGSSRVIQEIFKQIAFTTINDSPVLITGESGTGKELTARSIHQFGRRQDGPFVAVNIASLNPSLAESELFGHVAGAFTGASSSRIGLIEQAHGGTLFLDEVGEIPLDVQVKLLRVLDQNEVVPVGSNTAVQTDFRLVSATHQDLLSQVNHAEFRQDLFYRLRTFEIQLPPLRQRKEDIPELVQYFLNQLQSDQPISATVSFLEALQALPWPGNIRELRNAVERAAIVARGGVITADHLTELPSASLATASKGGVETEQQLTSLAAEWIRSNWELGTEPLYESFLKLVEPAIFQSAFELTNRQYSAAARRLGIHRNDPEKEARCI